MANELVKQSPSKAPTIEQLFEQKWGYDKNLAKEKGKLVPVNPKVDPAIGVCILYRSETNFKDKVAEWGQANAIDIQAGIINEEGIQRQSKRIFVEVCVVGSTLPNIGDNKKGILQVLEDYPEYFNHLFQLSGQYEFFREQQLKN